MKGEPTNSDRRECVDDLIAYHLNNYKQPDAHSKIAAAFESSPSPRALGETPDTVSGEYSPKKMQKRYIEVDEVNALLQAYVACNVREQFVPAVVDDVGSPDLAPV